MFNIRDLLRLAAVPRIGPLKVRALISSFKDPAEVLNASPRELVRIPGIDKKLASAIVHNKDGEAFADEQLRRVNKANARIVTIWDKEYPDPLKKIYDPPAYLYVFGKFVKEDSYSIALVGTRHPSPYGERVAESFSKDLVRNGITTVSGLARGIDTIVHGSTLRAGGRTIAVIGSGLDVPYPSENKKLMERIANEGVVVSEFPMGAKPDKQNFPRRNRIISGLSVATIVVESDIDGGAMITASTAFDQDRTVFAVPGNIGEKRSKGPNTLIRDDRARLVTNVDEVIEELRPQLRTALKSTQEVELKIELTLFEQHVYDVLTTDPLHIDYISEKTGLSTPDALVTLLSMEFKGVIRQMPGKYFVRC